MLRTQRGPRLVSDVWRYHAAPGTYSGTRRILVRAAVLIGGWHELYLVIFIVRCGRRGTPVNNRLPRFRGAVPCWCRLLRHPDLVLRLPIFKYTRAGRRTNGFPQSTRSQSTLSSVGITPDPKRPKIPTSTTASPPTPRVLPPLRPRRRPIRR